jgi:hypothetical protein
MIECFDSTFKTSAHNQVRVVGALGEVILSSLSSLCTFSSPFTSRSLAQGYHAFYSEGFPEFTHFFNHDLS